MTTLVVALVFLGLLLLVGLRAARKRNELPPRRADRVPGPQTITYVPKKTNHIAHLIATIFTFGLWAPVWFLSAFGNQFQKEKHVTYTVD